MLRINKPKNIRMNFNQTIFGFGLLPNPTIYISPLEHGARLVFDRSMTACQISVLEDYEFILVRIRKRKSIFIFLVSI